MHKFQIEYFIKLKKNNNKNILIIFNLKNISKPQFECTQDICSKIMFFFLLISSYIFVILLGR